MLSRPAWDDSIKHTDLKLSDIEERTGIKRASLSGLLGGHSRASTPNAKKIADTLGVHVETLFPTLLPKITEVDDAEAAA